MSGCFEGIPDSDLLLLDSFKKFRAEANKINVEAGDKLKETRDQMWDNIKSIRHIGLGEQVSNSILMKEEGVSNG